MSFVPEFHKVIMHISIGPELGFHKIVLILCVMC